MNEEEFVQALLSGRSVSPGDWKSYFRAYHGAHFNAGREFHARLRDESGLTSYETVAAAIPASARTVVDVGCGDGSLVQYVRAVSPSASYQGIDISSEEIARARDRYADSQTGFAVGDADALPFPAGATDCVVSHLAIMLVEPVSAALVEIRRVLAADGTAVLLIENRAEIQRSRLAGIAAQFIRERFPKMTSPVTNPGVRSAQIFGQQLRPAGFSRVESSGHVFTALLSPAEAADYILSFYVYASLDVQTAAELRERLLHEAAALAGARGSTEFAMPLTLFIARP